MMRLGCVMCLLACLTCLALAGCGGGAAPSNVTVQTRGDALVYGVYRSR